LYSYRIVDYDTVTTIDTTLRLAKLLAKFPGITLPSGSLKCKLKHNTIHVIETNGPPVTARSRKLPPDKLKFAKAHFEDLLRRGDIQPSKSPWASPIHLTPKKGAEKGKVWWGLPGLERGHQARQVYPVSNMMDFNVRLEGTTRFTVIDIFWAYNHIPIQPEYIEKTAVITPFGFYEYVVMPFGLRNAAQTFQRFIDNLFWDLPFVYTYLDGILVTSAEGEDYKEQVRQVLKRLNDAGIFINVRKCQYKLPEVTFVGY
jgi:hypothetical protein